MARRARQQEQQKRREAEQEAAMGFNPKPSKFMDLDQLQHQGMADGVREGWRTRNRVEHQLIDQGCFTPSIEFCLVLILQ